MPSGPDDVFPLSICSTSAHARCLWHIKSDPSMRFTGSGFRLVLCRCCLMHQATVFPLVTHNDVIVAIVAEFRAMYRFVVPEIPFALCLHDVLGYVQCDFA